MDDLKPSRDEDEYFLLHDAELLKEQRARLDAERLRAERSAHYMKCPKCGADLVEREFSGVKVDVCPTANGMWNSSRKSTPRASARSFVPFSAWRSSDRRSSSW
jgi:hypothetical protein